MLKARSCLYDSSYRFYSKNASAAAEARGSQTLGPLGTSPLRFPIQDEAGSARPKNDSVPESVSRVSSDGLGDRVPSLKSFGKWKTLSLQSRRLAYESSLTDPLPSNPVKLVDLPENRDDVSLWACLLEFRRRRDGRAGVKDILNGLLARRTLREFESHSAQAFWRALHLESLRDDAMMRQVWEYAEWTWRRHSVRWPNLYHDTITFFLVHGEYEKVLRWNIQLSPNFGLDDAEFFRVLKRFITNPDQDMQDALKKLYWTSIHRSLYDNLISHLHANGCWSLALDWRWLLLTHHDLPKQPIVQPFLQCLAGYAPEIQLAESEVLIAGLGDLGSSSDPTEEHDDAIGYTDQLRYTMNRIHGQTFGIEEKTYNDPLLARLFASSWISLDMAIDVARIFGVDRIGPLSLQSLALREGDAARVSIRLEQLEEMEISIGDSCYAKAIRQWANSHDEANLRALLHSDVHPDVFDDEPAQEQILQSASATGNLKLRDLIVSVRRAVSRDSVVLASNRLLYTSLLRHDRPMVLHTLRDMVARDIQLLPSTSHAISMHILEHVSPDRAHDTFDATFHATLCCEVAGMRFPLATSASQTVLRRLCDEGELQQLENLTWKILKSYKIPQTSKDTMFYVHQLDLPDILQKVSQNRFFRPIPRGLPLNHPLHPVQLIFNDELQTRIVDSGFRWSLSTPNRDRSGAQVPQVPADFGFARGFRLLALLREYGININPSSVTQHMHFWVSNLYGAIEHGHKQIRFIAAIRRANRLTLAQTKELCDLAWGSKIVPLQRIESWIRPLN
jgi:hypothetical protein